MQLTLYTDYSLRVLVYLGLKPDSMSTISEIAEAYEISRNHLVKVVHNLANLGYINTTRGKGGGIRLAHVPENINIGEVVRKTELSFDVVECFSEDTNTCPISPVCALKGVLYNARKAFIDVLDGYTLADAMGNSQQLKSIFKIVVEPVQQKAEA